MGIIVLTAKKDIDTVSEAGTIKDSDSGGTQVGNDNTKVDKGYKESILVDESKCPPQLEESSRIWFFRFTL